MHLNSNNQDDHLPKFWEIINLENVVEILDNQRVPINSDEREKRIVGKPQDKLYPYYGATGQVGWIDGYIFNEELVLLGEDGAPFYELNKNKAYLIHGKSWVNNHAHVLRAIQNLTNNKFIMHYLNFFDYHGYVTGTTRLKLPQSPLKQIPVPLPPVSEQERIVDKIDELFAKLDAGVNALEKIKTELKRYRQAVLKFALAGKLTEQWRKEKMITAMKRDDAGDIEIASPDESRGRDDDIVSRNDDLPNGWKLLKLKEITQEKDGLRRGPFGSAIKKEIFILNGYKVYEQGNAINDDPYRGRYYISEGKYQELINFKVIPGDLIVSCSGVTLGRISEIPEDAKPGIINQALLRIRLKPNLMSNNFFINYFRSDLFQKRIFAQSQGTAMPNLVGIKDFKEIELKVPPISKQREIVVEIERRFTVADEVEKVVDQSLTQAERLRQSILKSAFTGKLTEQWRESELSNPNSVLNKESAEKLLKKIRLQRLKIQLRR